MNKPEEDAVVNPNDLKTTPPVTVKKGFSEALVDLMKLFAFLWLGIGSMFGCYHGVHWSYRVTEEKIGAFFGIIAGVISWGILTTIFLAIIGSTLNEQKTKQ